MPSDFHRNQENHLDVISKLERTLQKQQLLGNLEHELKICYLLGKKFELLGKLSKAMECYASAREIATMLDMSDIWQKATTSLLWIVCEVRPCLSHILDLLLCQFSESIPMSVEICFFVLSQFVLCIDFAPLIVSSLLPGIKSFVASLAAESCVKTACSFIIDFLANGEFGPPAVANLKRFSATFSCGRCDMCTHVRIFHVLGQLCIYQGLNAQALVCYDLALSLCEHDEATEFVYLQCLIKMIAIYALDGSRKIAVTTFYLARDISARLDGVLDKQLKTLYRCIECLDSPKERLKGLYRLCAYQAFQDELTTDAMASLRSELIKSMVYRRHNAGLSERNIFTLCNESDGLYVLIYDWLSGSCFYKGLGASPPADEALPGSAQVSWRGLHALLAGNSIAYANFQSEYKSIVKADCLSHNHNHCFSYFLSRSASKSMSKLVDGFKMDSKGQKRAGTLHINSRAEKKHFVDHAPKSNREKQWVFEIAVGSRLFEHKISNDVIYVSTVGWMKNLVTCRIVDEDLVEGELEDFVDPLGQKYNDHMLLCNVVKACADRPSCRLTSRFRPLRYQIDRMLETTFHDSEPLKQWIGEFIVATPSVVSMLFLGPDALPLLDRIVNSLSIWDSHCALLRVAGSQIRKQHMDALRASRLEFSCCTIGPFGKTEIENAIELSVSFCKVDSTLLSELVVSVNPEIAHLSLIDSGYTMDSFGPATFPCLRKLDLSFSDFLNVYAFLGTLQKSTPSLESLHLDGIFSSSGDVQIQDEPNYLPALAFVSLRFSSTGRLPAYVLEAIIPPQFSGVIDLRHSSLGGYEDRIGRSVSRLNAGKARCRM